MRKLFMLCFVALTMACGSESEQVTPTVDAKVEAPALGTSPGDAYLQGHLHDMDNIDGFAREVDASSNSYYHRARIYVEHESGGEAMSILNVDGGNLYSPEFEPGQTMIFDYLQGNEASDLRVTLTGCLFRNASVSPYYDNPADEVEIFTEMLNEDVKRVNYIGRWFDFDGNVTDEYNGFINIEVR